MKALVGAFNQEKTLVGAFSVSVNVKTGCGTDGSFYSTSGHGDVRCWDDVNTGACLQSACCAGARASICVDGVPKY